MKQTEKAGRPFQCFGKMVNPPQTSIHPRVENGRTVNPKVNTARPKRVRS